MCIYTRRDGFHETISFSIDRHLIQSAFIFSGTITFGQLTDQDVMYLFEYFQIFIVHLMHQCISFAGFSIKNLSKSSENFIPTCFYTLCHMWFTNQRQPKQFTWSYCTGNVKLTLVAKFIQRPAYLAQHTNGMQKSFFHCFKFFSGY